ncbi:hypothetical protein SADUNF_Sadunf01G0138200 [Salix dunnii]|uniref:Uncharacterized protein n=1 Tax=Salix dunnii TaxID=1413687 RepID=A0A835NC80_9ROSI|nr:hypothetical protein SADUNF_Sadunf01G0138200 [Salix dunnii]
MVNYLFNLLVLVIKSHVGCGANTTTPRCAQVNTVQVAWHHPFHDFCVLVGFTCEQYGISVLYSVICHHLTVLTVYISLVWHYLSYPRKQFDGFCQVVSKSLNYSFNYLSSFELPIKMKFMKTLDRWKHLKYMSKGSHGFIEAETLLEKNKAFKARTSWWGTCAPMSMLCSV